MAPFEILRELGSLDRIPDEIEKIIAKSREEEDHARNLTVEMASNIHSRGYRGLSTGRDNFIGIDVEEPEGALCDIVLSILREITSNALGNHEHGGEESQGVSILVRNVMMSLLQTGAERRFALAADLRLAASDQFMQYSNSFDNWDCQLKGKLLKCISGKGSLKVVNMAPDLSSVMFCQEDSNGPSNYLYLHSGSADKGMLIKEMHSTSDFSRARSHLRYRRGAWEACSVFLTIVAWIYVLISIGVSVYRSYLKRDEGFLEAAVSGVEVLSILLIAIFGFVKLYIYDNSVLFRLMTGWKAMNSRESLLKHLCKLEDLDECEAEMTKDGPSRNELFSFVNASTHRNQNKTGSIRLEGLKDEYLGRAGYIGFGCVIIDYILQDIILVRQYHTGVGHFEERKSLTTENIADFLERGAQINDSGERQLVTRRMFRYD